MAVFPWGILSESAIRELYNWLTVGHNADGTLKGGSSAWKNVVDFGAKGDGATDDTAAIQAALNATPNGGTCVFPPGKYLTSATLTPPSGIKMMGAHYPIRDNAGEIVSRPAIQCSANVPVIQGGATVYDVTIEGLAIEGQPNTGSIGVNLIAGASGWKLANLFFNQFGDQAVLVASNACVFEDIWIQNSLMVRTGRVAYVGCFDIGGSDHFIRGITSTASWSGGIQTGFICGIVIRGSNCYITQSIGHIAEVGIADLNSSLGPNVYMACRADLDQKWGWVFSNNPCIVVGCSAWRDGQAANATYPGFRVETGGHNFVGCKIDSLSGDANKMSNGFDDVSNAGAEINSYFGNQIGSNVPGVLVNKTGSGKSGGFNVNVGNAGSTVSALGGVADKTFAETYSASITPNATLGNRRTIVVTNATAFTINAPTNPISGQELTFDIKNTSGGAMGAITWNAVFLLAGAFVNPATGKRRTITFYYDGTNWIEVNRAAADI